MMAPAVTFALGSKHWRSPARLAAAGELVADKLPATPSRLFPPSLVLRIVTGAFCGRTIARRRDASGTLGALGGALGAFAGSYGGYYARRYLTQTKRWPAVPVALAEDALAYGVARLACMT